MPAICRERHEIDAAWERISAKAQESRAGLNQLAGTMARCCGRYRRRSIGNCRIRLSENVALLPVGASLLANAFLASAGKSKAFAPEGAPTDSRKALVLQSGYCRGLRRRRHRPRRCRGREAGVPALRHRLRPGRVVVLRRRGNGYPRCGRRPASTSAWMRANTSPRPNGFFMKSSAPMRRHVELLGRLRVAADHHDRDPARGLVPAQRARASKPPMPGSTMSRKIRSGVPRARTRCRSRRRRRPRCRNGFCRSMRPRVATTVAESSMISTRKPSRASTRSPRRRSISGAPAGAGAGPVASPAAGSAASCAGTLRRMRRKKSNAATAGPSRSVAAILARRVMRKQGESAAKMRT